MHGLFGLIVPLLASASLVLTDGQVIKGSEVTRQGDTYLVSMEGGNAITFPAALVKEVRFGAAEAVYDLGVMAVRFNAVASVEPKKVSF